MTSKNFSIAFLLSKKYGKDEKSEKVEKMKTSSPSPIKAVEEYTSDTTFPYNKGKNTGGGNLMCCLLCVVCWCVVNEFEGCNLDALSSYFYATDIIYVIV